MTLPSTIEIVKLGERFAEKYEATCHLSDDERFSGCGTVFRYTIFDVDPQSKSRFHTPFVRCPACERSVLHDEANRLPQGD